MKSSLTGKIAVVALGLAVSVNSFAYSNVNSSAPHANRVVSVGSQPPKSETVRIGLAGIKTGAVGEGVSAQDLAAAVANTLGEYLKGTNVEIVPLEARLASAIDEEAAEKRCAFVLYASVSHKKGGGGGFGKMFSTVAPVLSSVVPMAGMAGGIGSAVAGSVASGAISSASSASQNVKPKDEVTLDLKLQKGGTVAFTKQYKAKAKSGGEDLISPLIEQAAQAIVDTVSK